MNDLASRALATTSWGQLEDVCLRLAAIVDSSDDAIISTNLDGVILTWNRAAQRLFGYSQEEAIGQPITIIIPPELPDEETEILRRVRAGERIEHYETRRLTRDKRSLDVSLTVSPLRDAGGTIVGASKISRDITESRQAQAALRESRQRLERELAGARTLQSISARLISELNQESLFTLIVDAAMELTAADAASIQMLAPDEKSLILLGWRNFHPDSAAFWQLVTAEAGTPCGAALRDMKRVLVTDLETCEFMAGTQHPEECRRSGIRAVQSTPLQSRTGRPLGILSTHWRTPHTPSEDDLRLFDVLARQAADLIERTRAESVVRESDERFRSIANTAPVIIWMSDTDKQCSYVNQTWLDLTGQSFDAALGTGWTNCMHPEDVARSWNTYASAFDRRELSHIEFRLRRHDGQFRWIVGRGVPRYNGDGSFAGYIGSAIDVSERRLAEEALATVNQRLIDAHEDERGRIARELHDDITQRLVLLSIRLEALAQSAPNSPAGDRQKIEEALEEVANLARDVQAFSHRLHPARLDHLGIEAAAAALCREVSGRHGVEVSFHAESVPKGLSRRLTICLYRVLQEALHNAIKHSGADKVEVLLRGEVDRMELTVRDSGAGFDLESTQGRGLGLISMKERLKTVHGGLTIRSQSKHGTTIQAWAPLLQDELEGSERG
jgi:PAS domain S-box-containing protein